MKNYDSLAIDLCRELYDRFMMGGWSPEDAYAETVTRLQQWADAENAALAQQVEELRKRLGKPRCLDCNIAGLTNCSHFDNCSGTWRYELETRAETAERQLAEMREARPNIICLCGSTRFIEQFAVKTWELELEGNIVLGCTLLPSWYCPVRDHFAESLGVKEQRDNQHLQKIDLADEVLVLNIGGYIGESTRNEIAYALAHGKPVKYLEVEAERVLAEKQ